MGFRHLTGTSNGVIIFSLHLQNTIVIAVVDYPLVIDPLKGVNQMS